MATGRPRDISGTVLENGIRHKRHHGFIEKKLKN
jgi:hypothetical protein